MLARHELIDLGAGGGSLCLCLTGLAVLFPFAWVEGDSVPGEEVSGLFVWFIDVRLDLMSLKL